MLVGVSWKKLEGEEREMENKACVCECMKMSRNPIHKQTTSQTMTETCRLNPSDLAPPFLLYDVPVLLAANNEHREQQ